MEHQPIQPRSYVAAQVNQTVRQYLAELEQQNPTEEPVHPQVSTTDPDATYATKGGTPARLGYYDNNLIDNHNSVILSQLNHPNVATIHDSQRITNRHLNGFI